MASDLSMASADTLRQALTAYLPDGFRDDDGVWHDGPVRQDALAALAALLAVGERDRQQIARLTEVGKAAQIVADLNGEMRSTYGREVTRAEFQAALFTLEIAVSGARAVLADEEDAGDE